LFHYGTPFIPTTFQNETQDVFKLLILELHHGFSWVTEVQQHTQATITDEPAENLFADLEDCSQKSISNTPGGYRRGKKKASQ